MATHGSGSELGGLALMAAAPRLLERRGRYSHNYQDSRACQIDPSMTEGAVLEPLRSSRGARRCDEGEVYSRPLAWLKNRNARYVDTANGSPRLDSDWHGSTRAAPTPVPRCGAVSNPAGLSAPHISLEACMPDKVEDAGWVSRRIKAFDRRSCRLRPSPPHARQIWLSCAAHLCLAESMGPVPSRP